MSAPAIIKAQHISDTKHASYVSAQHAQATPPWAFQQHLWAFPMDASFICLAPNVRKEPLL
jgi:hypothetical protein